MEGILHIFLPSDACTDGLDYGGRLLGRHPALQTPPIIRTRVSRNQENGALFTSRIMMLQCGDCAGAGSPPQARSSR